MDCSWARRWHLLTAAVALVAVVTQLVLVIDGASVLVEVVPLLVVAGWLVFGPRPRVTRRAVGWSLLWPLAWLAWTLVIGAAGGWFPYPFLDYAEQGWGAVVIAGLGITLLFAALFGLIALVDRRPATPWRDAQPSVGN